MKIIIKFISLFVLLIPFQLLSQSMIDSHTASIPNYESKEQPFKIFGKLYMSDGKTPAKNYKITINQANEDGDFEVDANKQLITSATIATNSKGEYTFYTYVPGTDRLYNKLQEIFMKVETPDGSEYAMPTLLFDTDPGLTKRCRKQIAKRSDSSRIIKFTKANDKVEIKRDMVLALDLERIN